MGAAKKTWYFPDMFYPETSPLKDYVSHEALCVLNPGEKTAHLSLTLVYEDREPLRNLVFKCGPLRTNHIRLDRIVDHDGRPLMKGVGYAGILTSDEPVVVQYTRVDTSQGNLSLMTTLGAGE